MHKIKNPFFKNFLLCLCIILTIKLIIIFIFLTQIRIKKTKQGKETPQFCFKEHCFILEIAKNQDEKEK
jgi:predicted membrane protein